MATPLRASIAVIVLLGSLPAVAQQKPSVQKTIPDSINYMWKMVENDFTSLAEAMPEEKWSFKPTQGAFADVRTFGEQVKHVAARTRHGLRNCAARSRQITAIRAARTQRKRNPRFWLSCTNRSS